MSKFVSHVLLQCSQAKSSGCTSILLNPWLDEMAYCSITKQDIWSAFFQRKMEYKKELSEELKDPEKSDDWALIMEAFKVLGPCGARRLRAAKSCALCATAARWYARIA